MNLAKLMVYGDIAYDRISVYSEDKSNGMYSEYILSGDSQDNDIAIIVAGFFWCQNSAMKNYSGV